MIIEDSFSFSVPLDIVKGGGGEMRIGGFASTPDKDRQNDKVIQSGFDISEFVNNGFINLDHQQDEILGYPDKAKTKIKRDGFYVEAILLESNPKGRKIYNTALELQRTNAPRRFGFSIEGKTLERDHLGAITKAVVYNVAVTPNPVNTKATWEALVKSFSKSMEAGYTTAIGEETHGASLKRESLEQAFHTLAKAFDDDEEASESINRLRDKLSLSKSVPEHELILYFQLSKGLSRNDSKALVSKFIKEGNTQ